MRLRERWNSDERFRFVAVGAANTAFGYVLFPTLFLLSGSRLHYLVVLLIAHAVAVTAAFVLHRTFAFRAEGAWAPQFVRFNLGHLGLLAIGLGGMSLLVERVHVSPLVAQPILMTATVVASYFWHSRVSFARPAS